MTPARDKPLVSVWKRSWLPGSETFVRAQQDGLTRWRSESVGWERLERGLGRAEDVILGERTPRGLWRIEAAILALTGVSPRLSHHWRGSRPDVVHIHFVTQAKGVAALARRHRIPVVVTAHGNDVTEAAAKGGWRGHLYRWQARRILRRADAVIAVSDFIAGRVKALGAPERTLHRLPVGVEIIPREDREPVMDVVFVGRLVEVKGVWHLLSALDILRRQGRSVSACIIGDGPDREKLQRFASERDLGVTFLGAVGHQQVPQLMASSRIFCGPSVTSRGGAVEGLGLVFLEAALQERPIVAFRSGGVGEAVADGQTGLLVSEGDDEALAAAIARLLDDPVLCSEMGKRGRARVESLFDREKQTAELEEVYDSLRSASHEE
ncbi:glycosyltransferase [Micrococcus sp.]|uniref:glycosyltransferase n=1 Tax=Micrococcus sp. TaxID=1271 RepID=UPI002A9106DD|nr:glycosyltransferase [Micrococcus sp.]MDY6056152.1 glycosyltransferase [Micrococcus sp.]